MATTTVLYDPVRKYLTDGTVDFDTDALRLILLAGTYNPAPAAAAWGALVSYAQGTVIVVTGKYYEALNAGVSSGTSPAFLGIVGGLTTDNNITWLCHGFAPPSPHAVYADVSAHELPTSGGYTSGGASVTGAAITQALRAARFSIDDAAWTSASFSARFAALYKLGTANAITNPLICYVLLDNTNIDVSLPVTGTFSLFWSASGLFSL